MRATVLYGAGDVRIENVADARLIEPTDALVAVSRGCICGSDLWPYNLMEPAETGRRMGHEAIGAVEAVGADVRTLKAGDVVVMPFAYSDGTCAFCHEGLHTSCIHGGFFGTAELPGALAEEFGATDIVSERGEQAVERVRELTGGFGVHSVLECVGTDQAMRTAIGITRPGGAVGRVGVPHYEGIPAPETMFYHNVAVSG